MTTRDFKPGKFYSRPVKWGRRSKLAIMYDMGQLKYYTEGQFSSLVRSNSSAYDYSDFVESDRFGNILKPTKGYEMDYGQVSHLVINSKSNAIKAFDSEESALNWIEEELDSNPKAKFKIFEPTYSLEPKRTNIMDLLTKIIKG